MRGAPRQRRQLGNFRQAFSHLALIRTAFSLHDTGLVNGGDAEPDQAWAVSTREDVKDRLANMVLDVAERDGKHRNSKLGGAGRRTTFS